MVEKGNRLVCADKACGYVCAKEEMSSVVINKNSISICDFQRCGDRIFVWQHMVKISVNESR